MTLDQKITEGWSSAEWVRHYLSFGLDIVPLEPWSTVAAGEPITSEEQIAQIYGGASVKQPGIGLLCGQKVVAVVIDGGGQTYYDRMVASGYVSENADITGTTTTNRERIWLFRAQDNEFLPNIELFPGVRVVGSGIVAMPPTDLMGASPMRWRVDHTMERCLRRAVPPALVDLATNPTLLRTVRAEFTGIVVPEVGTPAPPAEPDLSGWDGFTIDGKPAIEVIPDEECMGTEALKVLSILREDIFKRAEVIVSVVEDSDKLSGITRPRKMPKLRELSSKRIRGILSGEIAFFKWKKSESGEQYKVLVNVPDNLAENIVSRLYIEHVRQIEFVTEIPSLRPDGSIIEKPGYDETTGVLYTPKLPFQPVPEKPTRQEAAAAYRRIEDLFIDFPFAEPRYRAMAIAALLTPIARPAFRGHSPMFFVEANVRGVGKTLVVDAIHTLLYGNSAPRKVISRDDEEMRKKITTIGIEGAPIVLFDNIRSTLDSPSLESAITGDAWSDRALGSNKDIDVVLNCVWFGTGNNVEYAGDISRRIARIRMVSKDQHPEARANFKYPKLLEHIAASRETLIVDCLTVLRAYVVASKPEQKLNAWGGFSGWSSLVRAAIVWAGMVDPYSLDDSQDMDAESLAIESLIHAWERVARRMDGPAGSETTTGFHTATKVLEFVVQKQSESGKDSYGRDIDKFDDFQEAMHAVFGLAPRQYIDASKRVGRKFAEVRDRVFSGKHLVSKPNRTGVMTWSVQTVATQGVAPGEEN